MRAGTTLNRIRAIISVTAVSIAAKSGVIKASVAASYIRFRLALGEFFKRVTVVSTTRVSENELYFAEDYVDPTYASTPLYITFGKSISDTATVSDNITLVLS